MTMIVQVNELSQTKTLPSSLFRNVTSYGSTLGFVGSPPPRDKFLSSMQPTPLDGFSANDSELFGPDL
jgi:hypothetical protein